MNSPTPRLTPSEVAKQLRCATAKVRLLCAEGQLEHEYDARRYWITQEQVDAYRRRCIVRQRGAA